MLPELPAGAAVKYQIALALMLSWSYSLPAQCRNEKAEDLTSSS